MSPGTSTGKTIGLLWTANGTMLVPANALQMDVSGERVRSTDVVLRNNVLYDKIRHTNDFSEYAPSIACDMVWLLRIPAVYQRYITLMASVRAATQLVTNGDLTKLLLISLLKHVQVASSMTLTWVILPTWVGQNLLHIVHSNRTKHLTE